MKTCFLLLLLLIPYTGLLAQNSSVTGRVLSRADSSALPGATVVLENPAHSPIGTATDKDGRFRLERVAPGNYSLRVNYLGYKSWTTSLQLSGQITDLGNLYLEDAATTLQEVQIIGQVPLGEQKGDTVQFNAAAFKVAPDASAEDLVQKMPGITIVDGKIQAQGENVQQILVDGKRFFGADAETALRNLPAEMIAHIQVFDKQSDQAELSGYDDGNRAKTINIVTKPNRRKGQFGKAAVAYGTDNRYMAGSSLNVFNGDRRFTITGISNNINMQDFSVGETPGGGMRGRRGGSSGGGAINQNGNINFNNLSFNFNDKWGEKLEANGNYAYTRRDVVDVQTRFRDFVAVGDSGQTYLDNSRSNNLNNEHHFNLRLDYRINKENRLLVSPTLTMNNGSSSSERFGTTQNVNRLLNQTENYNNTSNSNLALNNNINYSHRFQKPGRIFTSGLTTSYTHATSGTYRQATNTFYRRNLRVEQLDQFLDLDRTGFTWQGNTSLSERVGDSSRMQLEYKIGNKVNRSDRYAYDFVEQAQAYTTLDSALSNVFRSEYLTQSLSTGYQYNTKKLKAQAELQYQNAQLNNEQEFPRAFTLSRTFHRVLPSAQLEYRYTKWRYLRLEYRTNTNEPSVNQLQNVIDNSNPVNVRAGNPNLRQSYQNRVSIRYNNFNNTNNQVLMVSLTGSLTQNGITNSTLRPDSTTILENGIVLERGLQFTRPVNVDGNWNINTSASYGQPLGFLKSNLNINTTFGYARRPGMINNVVNFSNNSNFKLGMVLSSNISERLDLNLTTNATYSVVKNSLRPQVNNNFYNQSTALRLNYTFLKGIIYRTELNHQYNIGLTTGYNNNFMLWNMSISKKLLKRNAAEISLSVNDLLSQNNNIRRNVTDSYIEDSRTNVLQRFFMVTFSYYIRRFTAGQAPAERQNQQ